MASVAQVPRLWPRACAATRLSCRCPWLGTPLAIPSPCPTSATGLSAPTLPPLVLASEIAREIRARILEQTGLTASAGVSYNKFLAKLASDQRKPNGQYVIPPEKGPAFVESLEVGRFHGVGPATEAKMKRLGIHTGADLKAQSLEFLQEYFGKSGPYYHAIARGQDGRQVVPNRPRKSVGSETTFMQDLGRPAEVEAGIASHAELPARVRALLPASEWRARGRALLVRRGAAWGASAVARGCCGEREYYEALVKYYLEAKRVREASFFSGTGEEEEGGRRGRKGERCREKHTGMSKVRGRGRVARGTAAAAAAKRTVYVRPPAALRARAPRGYKQLASEEANTTPAHTHLLVRILHFLRLFVQVCSLSGYFDRLVPPVRLLQHGTDCLGARGVLHLVLTELLLHLLLVVLQV